MNNTISWQKFGVVIFHDKCNHTTMFSKCCGGSICGYTYKFNKTFSGNIFRKLRIDSLFFFISTPFIVSFRVTKSSNSSLTKKFLDTQRTNTASCGLFWMSVDSPNAILKVTEETRPFSNDIVKLALRSPIGRTIVCLDNAIGEKMLYNIYHGFSVRS